MVDRGYSVLPLLQVAVARMRATQQVYALKIMNKWDMLRRGEVHPQTQNRTHIHKTEKRIICWAEMGGKREESQIEESWKSLSCL